MGDASFDDLLDSLDAIQAEHPSTKHYHQQQEDEFVELNLPPPPPPAPPAPVFHEKPRQAKYDEAPRNDYSAAVHVSNPSHSTPSRSGDISKFQRQSVVVPAAAPSHHAPSHHSPASGGADSNCAKCGGSLYGTEYVTAGGKSFHQDHFACTKCQTRIVGNYYEHHGQVHCPNCASELLPCTKCRRGITGQYMILEGRPYHNECVERSYCAQCRKPIEDSVLTALGKTWHSQCFTCTQCGRELGTQFISKDGHGICESCSHRGRPQCEKCHQGLSGEFITFDSKSYHQDCFVCHQCRSRLGTSGFYNVQGNLKCSRCAGR